MPDTQEAEAPLAVANDEVPLRDRTISVKTLQTLMNTPAIPDRWETVPEMVAAVLYGRELGLSEMESLYRLYAVNGGIACDSKGLSALIHAAGHYLIFTEMSDKKAEVKAMRALPNGEYVEAGVFAFTWEDAEQAGLTKQGTYQDYPADMLVARAVSRAAKLAFPDVTTGLLLPHEVGGGDAYIEAEVGAAALMEVTMEAVEVAKEGTE